MMEGPGAGSTAAEADAARPDLALRSDEDAALEALFRSEFAALSAFASYVSGRPGLGEELAQDAFMRLARRGVDGIAAPRAYLRRSVVNLWKNDLRRKALEVRLRFVAAEPAGSATPDTEATHDLRVAMNALSTMQRACIVLRFFDGFTEAEGASLLGISTSSFKTHTRRGVDKLRVLLEVDET